MKMTCISQSRWSSAGLHLGPFAVRGAKGQRPCRRLFTLLELLISLGILMLLVALLALAGRGVTRSWGKVQNRQVYLAELMAVDRTLDRILSNVISLTWRNEDNEVVPVFFGAADSLRLAYRHPVHQVWQGGIRTVQLYLQDGELRALYQARPFLDADKLDGDSMVSVLAEGLESIEFGYADWRNPEEGLEWRETWDPQEWTPVRRELPLAIRIRLVWADGREEVWLRRTPGSGYNERWGNWMPRLET